MCRPDAFFDATLHEPHMQFEIGDDHAEYTAIKQRNSSGQADRQQQRQLAAMRPMPGAAHPR